MNKIKEINLNDNNVILLNFNDINGESCFFKKKDLLNKVNDILMNLLKKDSIILNDINGIERTIIHSQIKIINHKLAKNKNKLPI